MSNEQQRTEKEARKPRFDGTINLGHILTASAMLIGGSVVWTQSQIVQAKQDARIGFVERASSENADAVKKVAEIQQQMARSQERVSLTLEMLMQGKKPQL